VTGSVLTVAEEKPEVSATAGDRLRQLRTHKGYTLDDVAKKVGFSGPHVSGLERGEKRLNIDSLKLFAELYEVTQGWILDGDAAVGPEVITTSEDEPLRPHGDVIYMSEPLDRPSELEGNTYKVKWPDSEHALYITINDIVLGGHRRPFEVFINSKNMEHFAWTVALTRMISAVFRRGGDVSFVVEELKAVFDPRGGAWMGGKYIPSILAAIGGVIEQHMIATGFIAGEGMGLKSDPKAEVSSMGAPRGKACSSCGGYELRMIEGCMTCGSCGFSKCG
jgi:ribonucleoside-diphosphate reductase alpha chain